MIELLIKEREARGWSQVDVGRKMGHPAGQTIWTWEAGRVTPGLPNLRAWAAVFNLDLVARPRR